LAVGLRLDNSFAGPVMTFRTEPLRPTYVFWHNGYVESIVRDLDGDGTDEILLYGTNNGLDFEATLVRLDPVAEGFVQERSPRGRRPAVLRETVHLPVGGMAIAFPPTVLSNPVFGDLHAVGSNLVALDPKTAPGSIRATVVDNVWAIPGGTKTEDKLCYEVLLEEDGGWQVRMLRYGEYLRIFLRLIRTGQLEDRWSIEETETLKEYRDELESRFRFTRAPSETWRSLEPADVRAFFSSGDSGGAVRPTSE
jgi:hypothetical protein